MHKCIRVAIDLPHPPVTIDTHGRFVEDKYIKAIRTEKTFTFRI